jgi:Cdc48 subfamily AAA family protein/ClpA/ClpB-like protein
LKWENQTVYLWGRLAGARFPEGVIPLTFPSGPTIQDISQERLEARIREVSRRLFAGQTVDDLETWHLAQVVEHCSKAISDIYGKANLDQILRGGSAKPDDLGGFLNLPSAHKERPLRRVSRVPDELKGIGDRCLYDIGMAGLRDYHGLSLETLGIRSYQMAAHILSILSNERELRDLFQRNLLRTLPIEEEIAFLRQCAARFSLHAHLLNNLWDDRGSPPGESPCILTPEGRAHCVNADLRSGEEADEEPSPPRSSGPGRQAEPRERLISRYERMLLFAGTDIERVRREMNKRVIDQTAAVDAICDDFLLNATGTHPRRIPQSYFLVGPTGVGKNHLMESLAAVLEVEWKVEIPFLIIEGPQYTYPSDINELKGATRGFIRSDETGILADFHDRASRSPLSILLVDEVEKAHVQLQRFFLSIMDRGFTHDNRGRELSFEGCVLAFTSNLGFSARHSLEPIGYRGKSPAKNRRREEEADRQLKKALSPEFVARLRVVRFSPLSRGSMEAILDLELARVFERFRTLHGLDIEVTPAARRKLIEMGFSENEGARHLAAVVQLHCNVGISRKIKRDEIPGDGGRTETIRFLREIRRGERAFETDSMERRVLLQTKVQVPYRRLIIDLSGEEIRYREEA